MPAVWQITGLKPVQHRIVWWFVDAGAIGKTLERGWQGQCAADLGIHRLTLRANIIRMTRMGVLSDGDKRGEVVLNASLFKRAVDREKIKVRDGAP